jgi:hypothetical protein
MVDGHEPARLFDSFLFPNIFQAFRISIQPGKLVIAFCALALICMAGWVMDTASRTVVIDRNGSTELDSYVNGVFHEDIQAIPFRDSGRRAGVFATLWNFAGQHLHMALLSLFRVDFYGAIRSLLACCLALVWAWRFHTGYSLIFFAIVLAVLSVAGGAICRMAAFQFARVEKPSLTEAVRFAMKKFAGLFTAPLTPVAIIFVVGAFVMLLGLWGNIPVVGELSVGLFLPLALLAAGVIAIVAIGIVGGLGLIAYEDSDGFDAISHSFSYVYAKPWRLGFYAAVAAIYGAICYAFVRFFLFFVVWIAYAFLEVGFIHKNAKLHAIWPTPRIDEFLTVGATTPTGWSTSAGAFLVHLWILAVIGLTIAFAISFYFSAGTIIYALMRHCVDRVPLNELYVSLDKTRPEMVPASRTAEETAAQTKPLNTDASTAEAGTPE